MGLSDAHKGYEYQDLITSYFIVQDLLKGKDSKFLIDKKEYDSDKFDDLTVINDEVVKRQIKYSEDKTVSKGDFSTLEYDLALDVLYNSWQQLHYDKKLYVKVLLAWDYNHDLDFLEEIGQSDDFESVGVKKYRIDINKIWYEYEEKPISTWRRLRNNITNVSRKNFKEFLQVLEIELCLPKASLDIVNKGQLERITIDRLKDFGVGVFPNHELSPEGVLLKLMNVVKNARANQLTLNTNQIINVLGLIEGYGNIEQQFPLDSASNIYDKNVFDMFYDQIYENNKTVLIGEPGSGKSWFISNFMEYLKSKDILFARHYCYTSLDDIFYTGRITSNIFMANLINDIMLVCPKLEYVKNSKYGVDENELQLLISQIDQEVVIIIDGLDHIERIRSSHESSLESNKTDIIEIIERINVPEKVKIIVVSQPICEVLELCNKGYVLNEMQNWDEDIIDKYIDLRGIRIHENVDGLSMTSYLQIKSNGNPLYITYLVNELTKSDVISNWFEMLSTIPDYNDDLKGYYDYLLKQIEEDHKVVYTLSGASFYLDIEELKSITHLGNYVEKRIKILRSILKESTVNGGFIIYHESFRRYVLELLNENGLSIFENIYKDLIAWLENTGVYTNTKAYVNLFRLLYEARQFDVLLEYASINFISESIFRGYGFGVIKTNADYIVKAATWKKSFSAMVILSELSNLLLSVEFNYEIYEQKYSKCIGEIQGFKWLSGMLIYEGKANMPLKEGLRVCYSCSRNFAIPPWSLYINKMLEKNEIDENMGYGDREEQIKYLAAASIDMDKNKENLLRYVTDVGYFEFMSIVVEEYSHRGRLDELLSLVKDMEVIDQWREVIEGRYNQELNEDYIKDIFHTIKTSKSIYGDIENKVKYLVANAGNIHEKYAQEVDELIGDIKDLSWFHNWIVFVLQASLVRDNSFNNGKSLLELYSLLNRVTEVANHDIRTMDLHGLRNEIYETIQKPLRKAVLSSSEWEQILNIIIESSSDTMVTFQNAMMGPLTTDRLFELVTEISNDENYEYILKRFGEVTEEQKTRRTYLDLADFYMQKAIFLHQNHRKEQGVLEFRNAIKMIMSYGQRRDRTLSRLIDTIDTMYEIDPQRSKVNLKKLGAMAVAVVNQTDGKETSRYENEWTQLLCKHEPELALKKFVVDLETYKRSWICENMLETILSSLDFLKFSKIGNALFKTLPNEENNTFLESYLMNIETMDNIEEKLLARTSIVDFISKFNFDGVTYKIDEQFIEQINKLCQKYDIACNIVKLEEYSIDSNDYEKASIHVTNKFDEEGVDSSNINKVLEFMSIFGYSDEVDDAVKEYLTKIEEVSERVKLVVDQIVDYAFEESTSRNYTDTQNKIILLGEMNEIQKKVKGYINLRIYLSQKDGWYQKYGEYKFFLKAYNQGKELIIDWYFEYFSKLYKPFESINGISRNIISMLANHDDFKEDVLMLWDKAFEVIDFRLSCRDELDWNKIEDEFENYNIDELCYMVLLVRLRYGVSEIHKSIFASLEKLIENANERVKLAKPFKRVLANHHKYINLSVIMLIQLIDEMYTVDEKEKYKFNNLEKYISIDEHADEGFLLLYLLKLEIKMRAKPIINGSDLEFKDYIVRSFKDIDKRHRLLETRGVYVDDFILEFFSNLQGESCMKKLSKTYLDEKSSLLMDNVQIHSDYLKALGNAVIETIYDEDNGRDIFKMLMKYETHEFFYHSIREDVILLNAINNSGIARPNDIILPKNIENSQTDMNKSDWVRVAYVEREYEYKKDLWRMNHIGDNCKIYQVCSAIGFGESDDLPLYTDSYRGSVLNHINPKYMYEPSGIQGEEIVVFTDASFEYNPFMTYYRYDYLAFTFKVLSVLEVTMKSTVQGLIGLDKRGECVVKYQNWCTYRNLTGEDERTPVLRGSQLLVAGDLFDNLLKEIGLKPIYRTISTVILGDE